VVDHPPVDEPGEGVIERRELLEGETVLGVVGVQEVEGVVQVDVVGSARDGPDRWRGCS
jgi:hypothetical protein